MEKPLVDNIYLLQKFQGSGGWTYAEVPEIIPDKKKAFGMVRVRGFIDGYEIKQYNVMPHGNGNLFLPVKAAIRKAIGKQAGDTVHIILWKDDSVFQIPTEILVCFEFEAPEVLEKFEKMSEFDQKQYINWIYEAKKEETKAERIATMLQRVAEGKKLI